MTVSPFAPTLRFWPLFAAALGVRFTVVALGSLLIPVQPARPIVVSGIALAGFPADLRPENDSVVEGIRNEMRADSSRLIEPWYRWDAVWMLRIARGGYANAPGDSKRLAPAFMPAMPAIFAAAAATGLHVFWAGLLVVNLAAAAGAALFAQIAQRLTGERTTALRAFILLQAFPTAFFYSAPYNEAFGLLFTTLALRAWMDQKVGRAAVWAALGSLARITGVAVGGAALAGWLFDDRSLTGLKRALIVAGGSFAGIVLFWIYLAYAVGDPFAGLNAHEAWGRHRLSLENPWFAIRSINDPIMPHRGEAILTLLFLILGIRAWLRRGAFWGALALIPIAQMLLSGTLLSGHRVLLASLPAFVELADLLRNRTGFYLTVGGFALSQLVLLNLYVHWVFAG